MRIPRGTLATGVVAALLAAPAAAQAQEIVAGPPSQFVVSSATIDQGQVATFMNLDVITHDVTATGRGPDGKQLFASPLIGPGASANIDGTQYLTSGDYPFVCSIHPNMIGTLSVSSNGTPLPRPGSGGNPPRPSTDTRPPSIKLKVLDSRVSKVRKRRALRIRVRTDEAGAVELSVRGKGKLLGTAVTRFSGAGSKTVKLKLTKAGRRVVKRKRKLRVSLTALARDATGNSDTKRSSKTLRR